MNLVPSTSNIFTGPRAISRVFGDRCRAPESFDQSLSTMVVMLPVLVILLSSMSRIRLVSAAIEGSNRSREVLDHWHDSHQSPGTGSHFVESIGAQNPLLRPGALGHVLIQPLFSSLIDWQNADSTNPPCHVVVLERRRAGKYPFSMSRRGAVKEDDGNFGQMSRFQPS